MLRRSLLLSCLLVLGACDGGGGSGDDGGLDAGEALVDAGPPLACATMTPLMGVLDDTVSVTFDTSMTETRPRDLGLGCGNDEAELRWAPQEVIEFTVPGDPGSTYAVEFTSNLPGTDTSFNTVLQARDTCETVPTGAFPPRCFDDVAATEFRTTGAVTVPGGTVLYVFVTGYSEPPPEQMTVDRGTVEVGFTVRRGDPPTLSDGFLRLANDDVRIQGTGTDPNADVRGLALNFYGPDGLLDIYGDGQATLDGDIFIVRFDDPPATGMSWSGGVWVRGTASNLGRYLRAVGATQVQLRAWDAAFGLSEGIMRPIEEATLVGLGETCNDEIFCRQEMVCSSGACIPGSAIGALCDGAPDITVPATSSMGATTNRSGATGAGLGLITVDAECIADGNPNGGIGAEAVYKVDVPLEAFDLVVSTDNPGTGAMTDTILYVRSSCPDSGSILGCNDDTMTSAHAALELRDLTFGTYYIFVERYGGLAMGSLPHEVSVMVRPIVPTGQPCDAATTRCTTGACPAAGMCP
ncbi:MAG: hypothetical protein H6719_21990 [Sandaracinaceae bacterium]|nr:hypothetical protein [Sandaracinaceae bacterium]